MEETLVKETADPPAETDEQVDPLSESSAAAAAVIDSCLLVSRASAGTASTQTHADESLPPQPEEMPRDRDIKYTSPSPMMAIHMEFKLPAKEAGASQAAGPDEETEAADPYPELDEKRQSSDFEGAGPNGKPNHQDSVDNNNDKDMSVRTPAKKRKKKGGAAADGQCTGRWTELEHQAFLRGLQIYGREWKKVASHIPTRTSAQVRSHAQKYFSKLHRDEDTQQQQQQSMLGPSSHHEDIGIGTNDAAANDNMSPSVRESVARILARPESVQAEVEDTLQRLRERYRQLQVRLQRRQHRRRGNNKRGIDQLNAQDDSGSSPVRNNHGGLDDHSSTTSLSSLQNEELIALSVLHGSLPHGDASSSRSFGSAGGNGTALDNGHDEAMPNAARETNEEGSSIAKRSRQE